MSITAMYLICFDFLRILDDRMELRLHDHLTVNNNNLRVSMRVSKQSDSYLRKHFGLSADRLRQLSKNAYQRCFRLNGSETTN